MSASVNKVIVLGNLGRDPEIRSTQDGTRIATLNLATSESWKAKSGERKERTEWHRVVIFNERLVDVAEKYLQKGSKVYIEGSLQTRKWTDKDSIERFSTEIVLQKFRGELTMLGDPPEHDDRDEAPASRSGGYTDRRTTEPRQRPAPAYDLDDEIPF